MSAWSPKSTAALVRERDLEFRCKQLLEQDEDRIVVCFTVETLKGRDARTAFITPGDPDPEIVIELGFTF